MNHTFCSYNSTNIITNIGKCLNIKYNANMFVQKKECNINFYRDIINHFLPNNNITVITLIIFLISNKNHEYKERFIIISYIIKKISLFSINITHY